MHELRMMKAMFDCDSHLAKKLTLCSNNIPYTQFELNELLIDSTLSLYNVISCYLVLGCRRASSIGSMVQSKFVPNLGEALGKNGNGQSKQHTRTIFVQRHYVYVQK